GNLQTASGKINKYSTVLVDKNRYSVPTHYAYCKASAVLHVDRVEIFYGNKKIASHARVFNSNQWSLDPDHYLELIKQRPQAFHSARPIRQWRNHWPDCLERLLELFIQKQEFQMKELTIYNTLKGRHETVRFEVYPRKHHMV
ncbi:MAG: hypothetical protein WBN77_07375, partial [Desulfobacterales bacterium]